MTSSILNIVRIGFYVCLVFYPSSIFPEQLVELSEKQKNQLENWVKSSKLSYAVLRSPKGQIVVLLGETHNLEEKIFELQEEIVNGFKYKGHEQFDQDKLSWFGQLNSKFFIGVQREEQTAPGKKAAMTKVLERRRERGEKNIRWLEENYEPDLRVEAALSTPGILFVGGVTSLTLFLKSLKCGSLHRKLTQKEPEFASKPETAASPQAKKFSKKWALLALAATLAPPIYGWSDLYLDDPRATTGPLSSRNVEYANSLTDWGKVLPAKSRVIAVLGNSHVKGTTYHLMKQGFKLLKSPTD